MFDSLRKKITFHVILAAMLPLLFMAVTSSFITYIVHKDYIKKTEFEIAGRVIGEINLVIGSLNNILGTIPKNVNIESLPKSRLRDYLELARKDGVGVQSDVIDELAFIDHKGMELCRVNRKLAIVDSDLRSRASSPEFHETVKRKKTYIGPVIAGKDSEEPYQYYSVPVIDLKSGDITGVLSARVRFSRMLEAVVRSALDGEGVIYVLNSDGVVVAHADPSVVNSQKNVDLTASGGIVQGLNDIKVIRTVRQFMLGDFKMYVAVEVPTSSAFTLLYSILAITFILLLICLVAGVAYGAIEVKKIIHPIETLASTAREISSGNYAIRAIKTQNNEIGALADSFNFMTDSLTDKIFKLDEKEREIRNNYSHQVIINSLLRIALSNVSNSDFFKKVLEKVSSLSEMGPYSSGAIFLACEEKRELTVSAHQGLSGSSCLKCTTIPFGECLCGRAAQTKEAVFAGNTDERHDRHCDNISDHGHYCIPFFSLENKLLGVVTFVLRGGSAYDTQTHGFLDVIAKTIALVLERRSIEDERLKLESKLRHSHKMEAIGALAGGIAHDFNNVLTPILGFAQLGMKKLDRDSSQYAHLDHIYKAGLKAKELVSQILAFCRQIETKSVPISPEHVCKEALKFLRASIPSSIEIKNDFDPQCGMVKMDPTQLYQIIMNLCTNAYHAMEKSGGTLNVSLKQVYLSEKDLVHEPSGMLPGSYVELAVGDTGSGIPPEILAKIFEPYFTTKEVGMGTGMGLSIVSGHVKKYMGMIRVESTLGVGSVFRISLPVYENEGKLDESLEEDLIQGGTERILYVEDEDIVAELGQSLLSELGYKVTVRNSGLAALELFRSESNRFDLILTDMTMFGMNGDVMATEMMKIRSDIPVILCTGYSTIITKEKAESLGIRAFVYKPLIIRELAGVIRKVLDEPKILVQENSGERPGCPRDYSNQS